MIFCGVFVFLIRSFLYINQIIVCAGRAGVAYDSGYTHVAVKVTPDRSIQDSVDCIHMRALMISRISDIPTVCLDSLNSAYRLAQVPMFSEDLVILFHVIPVSVANGRQECSVSDCLMNTCLCARLFSSQPGRCLWTSFSW